MFVEGMGASGNLRPQRPDAEARGAEVVDSQGASEKGPPAIQTPVVGRLSIRQAAREAARALRVSRVAIWRFEEPGSLVRLVIRYNRGDGSVQEDRLHPERLASAFRSLLSRTSALAVEDTRRIRVAEPVQGWLEDSGIRAVLAVPIREEEQLVGLATFEEGRSPREWTPEDRRLAATLVQGLLELLQTDGYTQAELIEMPSPEAESELVAQPTLPEPSVVVRTSPERAVRRMGHLETVGLLGAQEVIDALVALDVQTTYLRMLGEAGDRGEDEALVTGALEAGQHLEGSLRRVSGCLREGIPERSRIDLNQALPEMIPALSREMGENGRLRVAPSVGPLEVEANGPLLERALIHLVQNAREASGSTQTVRLSWGPAPEGAGQEPDWQGARIRVEDQGEGIPRRHLPWLFEPFFSSRSDGHPLRGLGLSVVQAIVEGHGGWIEVRSNEGVGTEVDLFLPLSGPAIGGELESARGEATSPQPTSRPRRILVLVDEPLLSRLVAQILTRGGYDVELCATVQQAGRHWVRTSRPIDLAIVARTLSGGRSGVEVGREWTDREPNLPVLLLDRHPYDDSDLEELAGFPRLAPPFEPGELVGRVQALLETLPEIQTPEPPSTGGSWLMH